MARKDHYARIAVIEEHSGLSCPEMHLWLRVLADAAIGYDELDIEDICWFKSSRDWLGSFVWVANLFDTEPEVLRKLILSKIMLARFKKMFPLWCYNRKVRRRSNGGARDEESISGSVRGLRGSDKQLFGEVRCASAQGQSAESEQLVLSLPGMGASSF